MKKHFGLSRYFVFALAATLCMPAQAMWRQAGQKMFTAVTQAVTSAAHQARLSATTLAETTKNLQRVIVAGRGQAIARVQVTMPDMRPLMTRTYTATTATMQKFRTHIPQVLQVANQVAKGTTAIGVGVGAAYEIGKYSEVCALNEFDINHLNRYSVEFINKYYSTIIERYKDDTKAFNALTSFAAKNLTSMAPSVLIDLLKKNPTASEQFTEPFAQHVATLDPAVLCFFFEGFCLLNYEPFIKPIKQHFIHLDERILQKFQSAVYVGFLLASLCSNLTGGEQFEKEAQKLFLATVPTELTNSEAKLFVKQGSNQKILWILEKEYANLETLSHNALDNLKYVSTLKLALLVAAHKDENPMQKDLKAALIPRLARLQKEDRLEWLQVVSILKHSPAHDLCNGNTMMNPVALTITEQHILSIQEVFIKNDSKYQSDKCLRGMVNAIIKAEHDYQADYYTFVHGQRWNYLLAEQLFTDLWGVHHGKEVKDYLFAHVRNRDDAATEEKVYKEVMAYGRGKNRQRLLFLNAPFFGNTHNKGSSTAGYFVANTNVGSIDLPLRQVFDLHNDGDIYECHKEALNELQQEYATLSNGSGNVLFFAIPKKLAREYVYLAAVGGDKKTLSIVDETRSPLKKFFLGDTKLSDDLSEVVETLSHRPEKIKGTSESWWEKDPVDQNEFCLIMVKEAMNPESGIKVKVFNAADPAKMQKFWKKYEAVMANIKTDIEAKMAGKPLPSQQRDLFERYQELFAHV